MNAIGTQLRDLINSGLARWRLAVLHKYMNAAAKLGRDPVGKHHIHPDCRDEQADVGRDCRTCLARPNSQARTRTGIFFPLVQLTTSRVGNLIRLIHTLAICGIKSTCIYTYVYQPGKVANPSRGQLLEREN